MKSEKNFALRAVEVGDQYCSKKSHFVQFDECVYLPDQWRFALACFKLKQKDRTLKAAAFIDRLLALQNKTGAFPAYLHDYPHAYKPSASLDIFFAFAQILQCSCLQNKKAVWEKACDRLEEYLQNTLTSPEESFAFACVLAYRKGKPLGKAMQREAVKYTFCSLELLARRWLFLQAAPEICPSILVDISSFYHPHFGYIGPVREERELIYYQKDSLLHALFQEERKMFSSLDLASALVVGDPFFPRKPLSSCDNWQVEETEDYVKIRTKRSLQIFGREMHFSFFTEALEFSGSEGVFSVGTPDLKHSFVAKVFWTHQKKTRALVNQKLASFFRLGDKISLACEDFTIEMVWELACGKGEFTGHLLRGERSGVQEEDRGQDRMLAIRALHTEKDTKLKIKLTIA